ncbi:putative integral membrane protein [Streptomyces ambofaciens ATCC 23877]|uniref:Putative integral membrane protein n=1 Tax=Streptomyces ambofaciens (strain ATCC 23877 / 3486 / DSM 40053 / JCM 4204 / NBRC 12836 / NRRL B-2516) TaxID=278992 RepID=A0A0K2AUX5_STRA7|nr:glycosyltransferase family 39 protein [Streptomyces ambofaciens]AKZ56706.1 putative integral membrane protein [Streptomyces ambofaciens ATCC 23877]
MTTHHDRTADAGATRPPDEEGWGPPATPGAPGRLRRLWRGRPEDPRWVRPAFLGLLLATALLYLYNLSASGYANSFYSAAVQAGSQSWKAFFFGSLDAANAITVDKPPAALWPMALAVRVFGLSSWSVLVPEVLMGVATVAVVYAAVRRRFRPAAGLIAGAVLALTPVAALMFRFNNPDALLALLMSVACWLVVRALEDGRTRWLVWAGAAIGFAFLAKTLQAFLILPALALVYGVCAPVRLRKRLAQLALAALAVVVCGGWWVAVVELWPASSRPYIGGSQNNSFLELTFGYNGLGRLNGEETGSVGGGGGTGGGGQWGETGWDRMFDSEIGGQISWLLPAALILLAAGLVATRRGGRTDPARASFLVWGGSLLTTAAVFSYMAGIFHQYYTVALAPYLAAVVGMGAAVLWERRERVWASLALAAAVTATAAWGYVLLDRTPDYLPWLRWAVLVGGLAAALGLVFAGRLGRRTALTVAGLGVVASLAAPTAYTLSTVREGHSGSIVTAGPAGASTGGGPGGGGRGGGFPGGANPPGQGQGRAQGGPGNGGFPGGAPGRNQPNNGAPGTGGTGGTAPGGQAAPGGRSGEGGPAGGGGGMGGLLDGAQVDSEARKLLEADAGRYTWVAAAIGAQNAASYQLSTGEPVMAIGGFNGTDPSPTLARFKEYVADGEIHYLVGGGGGGGMGGDSGTSSQITSWVEANFKEVTAGSATFYDLTQPKT